MPFQEKFDGRFWIMISSCNLTRILFAISQDCTLSTSFILVSYERKEKKNQCFLALAVKSIMLLKVKKNVNKKQQGLAILEKWK